MGVNTKADRKTRGRTSITGNVSTDSPAKTKPHTPSELKTSGNCPVKAGGGVKRGDRRDMSPTYTGNNRPKHGAGYAGPDVSTRKR